MPSSPPAIAIQGLRKTYRAGDDELVVLENLDLTIQPGEFVSVMGPSGSGKSTLLNMVGLLDVPTAGRLMLNGQPSEDLNERQRALTRRKTLGFVFQSFNLLGRLSALNNVILPMALAGVARRERKRRAKELLDRVGLGDRLRHKPGELSGGQKQRVAIARALALDPPILLADEPTGNLDSRTSADLMEFLVQLNKQGKTIFQVTHDETIARRGSRIVRLLDGRIVRQEVRTVA
jgi:putative ABC transport system ATP-binding protein